MSPSDANPVGAFSGTRRFEAVGPLGVGAMCVVYRVIDRRHGDTVALKTLKHLDSDSLYRLKQEFRALSHFDHPNLVSFYELLHSEEGWFVTMELVEGVDYLTWCRGTEAGEQSRERTASTYRSLGDLRFGQSAPAGAAASRENSTTEAVASNGRLPNLIRLRSTLRQLAEGVLALHAGGRIHRDLKPSNVLVSNAGRVVILDFGLVAEIDQDYTEGTLHQSIAGSAAYMSPEQSVGMPLTEASDWYSVGVMLYEALCGVWPFSGHLYQILTAKNARDPKPPSSHVRGVPSDLEELCMALLQRDPEARPTGMEILAALRRQDALGEAGPRLLVPFRFREAHLAALDEAWSACRWGRPVVALVRGRTGSGKTMLLRELVKEFKRRGGVSLKGRCYEWERLAYKAVDGLMDNLARVLRRADLEVIRALAHEDLSWLALMFPVIGRADALDIFPASSEGVSPQEIGRRAFPGLLRVVEVLAAKEPLVLIIDDAHWGDTESAELLVALLKARPDLKIMLVLTASPDVVSPFLRWLMADLQAARLDLRVVDMEPLAMEQACQLTGEMLGLPAHEEEVRALAMTSGGVPGVIRELVRQRLTTGDAAGSLVLDEIVVADIAGLPPAPRRLLEILAVAGGPVATEVAVVAAALGDGAVTAVSTLRAHRLCGVSGATGVALEVGSREVMDHVLDHTSEAHKRARHLALARAMEAGGEASPAALVVHYAGGGDHQKAAVVAWLAANRFMEAGAWSEAAWMLERALKHGEWSVRERVAMLGNHGRALAIQGRATESAVSFLEAVRLAPEGTSGGLRWEAATQLLMSGQVPEGLAELEALQGACGLPGFSRGLFAGGVSAWRRWQQRRRGRDFESRLRADVDKEQLLGVDVAWTSACALALVDPTLAGAYQPVHLRVALDVGEVDRVVRALSHQVVIDAAGSTDLHDWRAALERVKRISDQHPSAMGEAWVAAAEGRAALLVGQVDTAIRASAEAEVLLRRAGGPAWARLQVRSTALQARLCLGQFAEVAQQCEGLVSQAEHAKNRLFLAEIALGIMPLVRLAEGTAEAALRQGRELVQSLGVAAVRQQAQATLAGVLFDLYVGRHRQAQEALEAAWKSLARSGMLEDELLGAELWRAQGLVSLRLASSGDSTALRQVAASSKALQRGTRPWAAGWALALEAGVSQIKGEDADALWAAARRSLHDAGRQVDSAVLGWHLGDEQAGRWLADLGIRELDAFMRMWVPPR